MFEDAAAQRAYDEARDKWARADDAWETIKYVLAHDPEPADSVVINEAGTVRALTWHGARSVEMPTIVVVYEWDSENITILEAKFSNATAPQFGRA